MKSRLGVFLFYDNEGIVDRYIEYLLKEIRNELDKLIVVVNGKINDEGIDIFKNVADDIVFRENNGFDAGAWKYVITEYVAYDELIKYDSLVLFNDSFFGPLYSFKEIFEKMDHKGYDYWGISAHGECNGDGSCPYGFRPSYIQTYFLVFEKSIISDKKFFSFWEKLPLFKTFDEVAEKFSAVLTQHFYDLGYRWGVLCDTSGLDSEDRNKNFDHHTYNIYKLLTEYHYPFIKRRSFNTDRGKYLSFSNDNELLKSIRFIQENYNYDLKLIFKHITRKYEPITLKRTLGLDFIPESDDSPKSGEAVVIAHLVFEDLFTRYKSYLDNIPQSIDLIITTNSIEKAEILKNLFYNRADIRIVKNQGRDVSALLVGCADIIKKYKYLCFVHDKKSLQKENYKVGEEFGRMLWENTLSSPSFINGVIKLFENNCYLGILAPFGVYHGSYFYSSIDYWTLSYEACCKAAGLLNIKEPSMNVSPFIIGNCFWCRTDSILQFANNKLDFSDFPSEPLANDGTLCHGMERIIPYVAANNGYVCGWIYSKDYACNQLTNLRYMYEEIAKETSYYITADFDNFNSFKNLLSNIKTKKNNESLGNRKHAKKKQAHFKNAVKKFLPTFIINIYRRIKTFIR